jgi:hypothetical protein
MDPESRILVLHRRIPGRGDRSQVDSSDRHADKLSRATRPWTVAHLADEQAQEGRVLAGRPHRPIAPDERAYKMCRRLTTATEMIMTRIVELPLLAAGLAVAAWTAGAQTPSSSTPTATSTAPAAESVSAPSDASRPSDATLKKARSLGMYTVLLKGVTRYCWKDANVGTKFETRKCVDEAQLDEVIEQREVMKGVYRQTMTGTSNK